MIAGGPGSNGNEGILQTPQDFYLVCYKPMILYDEILILQFFIHPLFPFTEKLKTL